MAALAAVVLLAVAIVSGLTWTSGGAARGHSIILAVLSFWVVGSAVWFVALQVLVVRRLCVYCLVTHALGVLAAVGAIALSDSPHLAQIDGLTTLAGVGGVLVLILAQAVLPPVTFRVEEVGPVVAPPESESTPVIEATSPPVQPTPKRTGRIARFLGGKIALAVDDWPYHGSPHAEKVVALLFDYTCASCREMHQRLVDYATASPDELCVLMLPIPAHPDCNPTIQHRHPDHVQACVFSRLALAVWMAKPTRFAEWDRWVFTDGRLAPFGLALGKARVKTGLPDLAGDGSELSVKIADAVGVQQAAGKSKTPQLLMKRGILEGTVPDQSQLQRVLAMDHV